MATEPFEEPPRRDLQISLDRACLLRGGREIRLRAKTFAVLVYLHEHHGRLVTKEDLRLMALGSIVFFQGSFEQADRLLEESVTLADTAGAAAMVAMARGLQVIVAMERGDRAAAARHAVGSREAALAAGEPLLDSFSLSYFAYEALHAGDVDRAGELHERLLALTRAHGDLWTMGIILFDLALVRAIQHRHAEVRALCTEGIALGRQFGDRRAVAWCLGVLAGVEAEEGDAVRAARLRGAMEGLLDAIGSPIQPTYSRLIDERLSGALQQELGPQAYRRALAAGRGMSLQDTINHALEGEAT